MNNSPCDVQTLTGDNQTIDGSPGRTRSETLLTGANKKKLRQELSSLEKQITDLNKQRNSKVLEEKFKKLDAKRFWVRLKLKGYL